MWCDGSVSFSSCASGATVSIRLPRIWIAALLPPQKPRNALLGKHALNVSLPWFSYVRMNIMWLGKTTLIKIMYSESDGQVLPNSQLHGSVVCYSMWSYVRVFENYTMLRFFSHTTMLNTNQYNIQFIFISLFCNYRSNYRDIHKQCCKRWPQVQILKCTKTLKNPVTWV